VYVVNVGDSRCYLRRGPQLQRLTADPTCAEWFVEGSVLAADAPARWRRVRQDVVGGASMALTPQVYKAELKLTDTLLLCTDGLYKHVADAEIAELLSAATNAENGARALVTAANAAGGTDNITVVLARFQDATEASDILSATAARDRPTAAQDQPTEKATATATGEQATATGEQATPRHRIPASPRRPSGCLRAADSPGGKDGPRPATAAAIVVRPSVLSGQEPAARCPRER
jgi:hypothetical protein